MFGVYLYFFLLQFEFKSILIFSKLISCYRWGLSGYEDDRDLNMLVKFIEEPHRAADKEKKQAKKARQKNKKVFL